MPTANTLVTLLRDVCEEVHAGELYPVLSTGTSAGSATTLVDSTLVLPDADVNLFDGQYIRIDELVGSGPASGTVRVIRNGGFAGASGTFTVGTWTASLETGADYSRWKYIHPLIARNLMNKFLRMIKREVISPITLAANGDMEAVTSGSGADNWTYTNCTVTTTNGYSSTAARVRHGTYSLRASATGGAPTVESAALRVVENDAYIVSAAVMADVGVPTLAAYDQTASGNIADATATHNEEGFLELLCGGGLIYIPTPCESMSVRLTGTAASDDFYMDDVIVWPVNRTEYDLPSWIEDPRDVLAVGYYERGQQLVGTNAFMLGEKQFVPLLQDPRNEIDELGANAFRLRLPSRDDRWIDRPPVMAAQRPYTALSADSDTTTAQRET